MYIRNVSKDLERPATIKELAEEVIKAGSTLILADDTLVMAEHATAEGWISAEELAEVERAKEEDEKEATLLEEALGEEPEAPDEEEQPPSVVVDGSEREVEIKE